MLKFIRIILITFLLISCKNNQKNTYTQNSNNKILVDGSPYFIKGICYHPVPKGSDKRDFVSLEEDISLMKEANINTLRVYEPIDDLEVLNAIYKAGMKVIIGFGFDQNGFYDIKSGSYLDYVKKYKDHKAILMWELGNEYNYHPQWFDNDIANWYNHLNNAAKKIQQFDEKHLITTAHGELPDSLALKLCPNIDVWGMNVYRWDDPENIFEEWKKISSKPMYLSEAGGDSYMTITKSGYKEGVNEQAQADANAKILDAISRNRDICSGVTMFSFTDGWWKAGNNDKQDIGGWAPNSTGVPYDGTPNEEFWGIVDINRKKKLTFDVIKRKYKKLQNFEN